MALERSFMAESEDGPIELSREEFTEELARILDKDPDELRARRREMDWGPPWEGEVVETKDSE